MTAARAPACLDDEVVARLADDDLSATELEAIEAHIDQCASCRELVVVLGSNTGDGAGDPVDAAPWLRTGDRIGRYQIRGWLGAGGMGQVYRAHDATLGREVALKLVREAGAPAQQRLIREARAMASLTHRNVISVYDAGELDGRAFIAMELVDGATLGEWVKRTRPARAELAGAFIGAARGLAAAHRRGLLHRDFKPGNVLVDDSGWVRVGDFGLAVREDAGDHERAGTAGYMAPECLSGSPATERSDIYAYGVTLAECIALAGLDDHNLEAIAARASARDPAHRYRAVADLLADLGFDAEPGRSRSWAFPTLLAAVVAASAVAITAVAGSDRAPLELAAPGATAGGPLCLVTGPIADPAERAPTYVLTRLVSRLVPSAIAGFRDGDRCPEGARVVQLVGNQRGAGRAIVGGAILAAPGDRPVAQARSVAAQIAPGSTAAVAPPDHDWGRWFRLARIRERIYLLRGDVEHAMTAALVEDGADLEHLYAIAAWSRWVNGDLMTAAEVLRPEGGSRALGHILDAVAALSRGDTASAMALAARAAAAGDSTDPALAPLIDVVVGEAAYHGGDPVRGVAALERALAADPELLIAAFHLWRWRLSRGDWAGIERLADQWERLDPSASITAEMRARVLLGRGEYAAAIEAFDAVSRRGSPPESIELGRILALALAGREGEAAEAALALSDYRSGSSSLALVPEPTGYALALGAGSAEGAERWRSHARDRLAGRLDENDFAMATTMSLIDHLSGIEGAWVEAPSVSRRSYRFRDRAAMLRLLRGKPADTSAIAVAAFARGLEAEGDDPTAAADAYREALANNADDGLGCVILWRWARLARERQLDGRAELCDRIARPAVPAPLCLAARCPPR